MTGMLGSMKRDSIQRRFTLLPAALFILCLPFDAIVFQKICPAPGELITWSSYGLLLFGWLGLLSDGLPAIGWVANPLWLIALLTSGKGMWVPRVASVAALLTCMLSKYMTTRFHLSADEGGVCRMSAVSLLPGYWLWLTSMVTMCVVTWYGRRAQPRAPAEVPEKPGTPLS